MTLAEVKDWIKSVFTADYYYVGKLNTKHDKSIGVYQRPSDGEPRQCLGGLNSYEVKRISVLIHWSNDADKTEVAAQMLFDSIRNVENVTINNKHVDYIRLMVSEAKDVGTDENGIYERVIWFDLYYRKE